MTSEPEADTLQSEREEDAVDNFHSEREGAGVNVIQSDREEAGVDVFQSEREEAGVEVKEYEEEDEGEDYSLFGSSDDPEKKRNYKEYKRLVKEINYQNELLERIKGQIHDISCKPCTTRCEQNDLKGLYDCLDQEMKKYRDLINKAMHLQNFGSRRHYKEIPLVTTLDEDNMAPIGRTCENLQVQTSKAAPINRESRTFWRESGGETSDFEKSCSCPETSAHFDFKRYPNCESEENKLLREICAVLKTVQSNSKKPCQRKRQPNHTCKDNESIEEIKDKIECMQQKMNELNKEICKQKVKKTSSCLCPHHQDQQEPCTVQRPPIDPALLCPGKKPPKAEQFQKLKDNYLYLLTEFSKKDDQLKELTKKLKSSCGSCGTGGSIAMKSGNADESELLLLRNRVSELKEEQIEFKCLMKEQSLQLEDYRNKYLTAQQTVEEQCAMLEKLNMNNKRIEKQINMEVKEIRAKFQEKLNELLQFPKLLENEQIKLAQTCKEKEELETKLIIVCKELKSLKSKMENSNNDEDCKTQLQRCQQELSQIKQNSEEIQRQRDLLCEQLRTATEDLDTLRSESAKIIARTKERAELVKQQQKEQIDRLEKQLAQCRATACLSVSDRETVIREMQGQLNTLSYSFDAAQKQIKTLRNHIAFMSNENCFPAKC